MRSPDFTRTSAMLPPLYAQDTESFAQLDAYLGLTDDLARAQIEALEDAAAIVGPDAALRWPTDLPITAGPEALFAHYLARYDTLGQWVAFSFGTRWPLGEAGIEQRRRFLGRAVRLWRRRGTPRGFLDWFCLYFDLDEVLARPVLLEHRKAIGGPFQDSPCTATLFIPVSAAFSTWEQRQEAAEFVRHYAPAHVLLRVCFVLPEIFDDLGVFTNPAVLAPGETAADLAAYGQDLLDQQRRLRELLCSVVSVVSHANGIRLYGCPADDPPLPERHHDHLGIGALPTDDL